MTLRDYIESLRHKTVAVIGIGVSNTPLLKLFAAEAQPGADGRTGGASGAAGL